MKSGIPFVFTRKEELLKVDLFGLRVLRFGALFFALHKKIHGFGYFFGRLRRLRRRFLM